MTTPISHAVQHYSRLLAERDLEALAERLRPDHAPAPSHIPGGSADDPKSIELRWELLGDDSARAELFDPQTERQAAAYAKNIENFIGTVKVPVGIAGPLRVRGLFAQGDYYVPLATTEAALVASYNRGSALITEAGGASAMLLNEGVSRSPGFAFENLEELGRFTAWLLASREDIRTAAEATTRYGRLADLNLCIEGNHVYLLLLYTTGDAAGQNMVTIATEAAMTWILANTPVQPRRAFLEANFSGDKKASAQSFQGVRGKKIVAEVCIPADLIAAWLHTTPEVMVEYCHFATLGGILSGTVGVQGHYANGLAAMFIACGQDAACVAEAAVGTSRMEVVEGGALYASVTLPNLIVGSIGGGTKLPSQQAGLRLLGLAGQGHAQALAEVAAALCLAGEISLIGAISAGDYGRAHARLARGG
jgi:hydroxymethylglutaryl-CoA reductase (NADPH)